MGKKSKKKDLPERIDISREELDALLGRLEDLLSEEDFKRVKAMAETIAYLSAAVDKKGVSIKRLLKLIFGSGSEKTREVLGDDQKDSEDPRSGEKPEEDAEKKPEPKRRGNGRNGQAAYVGADRTKVPHESLKPGDPCPECKKGKVYRLPKPKYLIRVRGQAPLGAEVLELERLRCNLCGEVFTAKAPSGIGEKTYDETSASIIALFKYGSGLPFNRLERLEGNFGIPLPASTQWDIVDEAASKIYPALYELIRQGAQGEIVYNDDTGVKILDLIKENKEEEERARKAAERGETAGAKKSKRTGMFTTAVICEVSGRKIALFFSGREHAGENLQKVLRKRAAELPPPIHMCDGLSRNTPGDFEVILSNCTSHARRGFVDVANNFPSEVRFVLEVLRDVYKNDAYSREHELSAKDRLRYHQENSGPLMDKLKKWLDAEIEKTEVEPNSSLGDAISYMRKRWEPLTLFLRRPGAPLDNNITERALKKAILHRKNSLLYKTEHGAHIGDLFMSLIHTCELNGVNPFDYLTELQRHSSRVFKNPAAWMPWNYKDTLAKSPVVGAAATGNPSE